MILNTSEYMIWQNENVFSNKFGIVPRVPRSKLDTLDISGIHEVISCEEVE